jgi:2-methylcitrate dehydratase PrpD
MMKEDVSMRKFTYDVANYVVNTGFDDLPKAAIEKAKECILDGIGCAIGAVKTSVGDAYIKLAQELKSHNGATIIGTDLTASIFDAAFINAGLVNAMDYDDTGATGHPGSTTIPAALAVAEQQNASGREFLASVVIGYEALTTVGLGIQPSWQRYLQVHGIGTPQTFGAFSAAAKLLNLSIEEALNGLGIAGAFAPVPHAGKFGWEDPPLSWVKDNVAWPSKAGLQAAVMAKGGFLGSRDILDGSKGFWIMAGSDRSSIQSSIKCLGRSVITDVAIKPYPCCRWIHPTLDALNQILIQKSLEPKDIEAVQIESISFVARHFTNPAPQTMVDAEFSVPYCVSALIHDIPLPNWHLDDSIKDRNVLDLASKVHLRENENFQDAYLKEGRDSSFIPTKVTVLTEQGQTLEQYVEYARGGAKNPLSPQDLEDKFRSLTSWYLGERVDQIIKRTKNLEVLTNIRSLLK